MLNGIKGVYDEWKENGNFVRRYIRVRMMYMRGADIKSYSENMKMIEIIRPDVKKCYKPPTIRFVRVEEECILTGGSPIKGEVDNFNPLDPGSNEDPVRGGAKRGFMIFDDTETE